MHGPWCVLVGGGFGEARRTSGRWAWTGWWLGVGDRVGEDEDGAPFYHLFGAPAKIHP